MSEQAVLRANAQLSHFATSSGGGNAFCDRCGKPLNRWDEKCDYQPDAAHLLAEDVLALVAKNQQQAAINLQQALELGEAKAENQRLRDALERIVAVMGEGEAGYTADAFEIARAALADTPSEDTE